MFKSNAFLDLVGAALLLIFGLGVIVGWVIFEGAPMLWHWAKPWIHVWTA